MGKLLKGVVKFTVAAAAIGGVCYAFKDQIKESKIYKDYEKKCDETSCNLQKQAAALEASLK